MQTYKLPLLQIQPLHSHAHNMNTIKASAEHFLTQSAVENEDNRIFVREISGMGINEADWREATPEEKAEWEAEHPTEEPTE